MGLVTNKGRIGIYIESLRSPKMTVLARSLLKAAANRQFSTSIARRSGHGVEPPGPNLPFQIQNRFRLTMNFCIFFATGFGAPFFMVRHQMLKMQVARCASSMV